MNLILLGESGGSPYIYCSGKKRNVPIDFPNKNAPLNTPPLLMVTLWNSNMAMENPSIIDVYVNLRGFPVAMFDYWRVFFWFKNIKQLLVQIPIFFIP